MTTLALKLNAVAHTAKPAARRSARCAFTWELAAVLTLMGSSAACALSALAHLG